MYWCLLFTDPLVENLLLTEPVNELKIGQYNYDAQMTKTC